MAGGRGGGFVAGIRTLGWGKETALEQGSDKEGAPLGGLVMHADGPGVSTTDWGRRSFRLRPGLRLGTILRRGDGPGFESQDFGSGWLTGRFSTAAVQPQC